MDLNKSNKALSKEKKWFRKMRNTNSSKVNLKYQQLKRDARTECRRSRRDYVTRLSEEKNNKQFWSYVKSKRKDNVNNSPLRDASNKLQYDAQTKSNILNNQFSSVFNRSDDKDVPLLGHTIEPMPQIKVTVDGVLKLLKNLSPNKSPGPDGIPARLLKELAVEIAPVFTILFQAFINQGKIPKDWKAANITPIFKKGDPCDASNYRPVSLTSIPCKILEHVIHSNVINHLLSHKTLTVAQRGFRKSVLVIPS